MCCQDCEATLDLRPATKEDKTPPEPLTIVPSVAVSTNSTASIATTATIPDLHTPGIWTKERYEATEPGPAMLPTGSFKGWNVDQDLVFGDDFFLSATGVRNFVEDSGFLKKMPPAEHPWWRPQLTEEMCKRNGPLEHVDRRMGDVFERPEHTPQDSREGMGAI